MKRWPSSLSAGVLHALTLSSCIAPCLHASDSTYLSSSAIAASGIMTEERQDQTTPTQAYEWLKAGNERFRNGSQAHRNLTNQREALAHGQHPYASIVSCMDSRTSVEYIFDANLGDLFNCRIAGNIVNDDILGSLEYAHKVAGAKLLVVLGHSSCGAVKGAADNVLLGNLTPLCAKLRSALAAIPDDGKPRTSKNHDFIDRGARMNVIHTVRMIRDRSSVLREMHDRGLIDIIGAFYDLETGRVEFYRPLQGTPPIRNTTSLIKEEAAKTGHAQDNGTDTGHAANAQGSPDPSHETPGETHQEAPPDPAEAHAH
ncbi:MAG: carbonic anhydrase family protein [Opitutaceae bacterium]|nr:carbonic anhydrase family protein [Opitutaceae bacterium]